MDKYRIKNELVQLPYLSGVKLEICESYKGNTYESIVQADMEVLGEYYPIIICIPRNWKEKIIDIYVETDEILYIPHIDKNKKLCLYDLEGKIIEHNLLGVLIQCVKKARTILIEGINGDNKIDFLTEFDTYIGNLTNHKYLRFLKPKVQDTHTIYFSKSDVEKKNKKKNKKKKANKKNNKYVSSPPTYKYFAAADHSDFKEWNIVSERKKGIYIYIRPQENIYPPNLNGIDILEYFNFLLTLVKPASKIKSYISKRKRDMLFVFGIDQPDNVYNEIGFLIKDGKFEINGSIRCCYSKEIYPMIVESIDEKALLSRTHYDSNKLRDKKFLLIGCGSIGGYVFHNLIKAGCKYIDLVDPDCMKEENIHRHILGKDYLYNYKVEALRVYGENNVPYLKINTYVNEIENAFEDNNITFERYDYIISATGNEIVNRWINRYVYKNDIETPVIYVWNEPLDIGLHVALIEKANIGCYDCFFRKNNNVGLSNILSYCKPGQDFTETLSGCGGTFIPYGSMLSQQSGLVCMDILKRHSEGRICGNVVVSQKGNEYYFLKSGLQLSDKFYSQVNTVESIEGSEFRNIGCGICGNVNES